MTFFGFAFCFEVFLPFDRQGQYFLFLTTMPFFHGAAAAAAAAKSLQSCPTLCDPTDGSPPDSTIPGILQARTLEWVAISFSIHGATEFLYKKLWFIILKRLVVNYFFLFKLWLICLLQLPILRVQFIPPSLVSLIDFVYFLKQTLLEYLDVPGSAIKNPSAMQDTKDSISGSGRSPGKGNGNPLWYSCLGNPRDKGAWWATVYEVPKELEMT